MIKRTVDSTSLVFDDKDDDCYDDCQNNQQNDQQNALLLASLVLKHKHTKPLEHCIKSLAH